jgi:hypothetical protein
MIAKAFGIAKTFRSHSANFLRHAKSLRDHAPADETECAQLGRERRKVDVGVPVEAAGWRAQT